MIETLGRIDTGDRSLRVERERFVSVHGPRTVLRISVYRLLRNGSWHRERAVTVRKGELDALSRRLSELARS